MERADSAGVKGILYQLKLQRGLNTEGSVYRLQKGDVVRFTLGSSLIGQEAEFFTNHPESPNKPFKRDDFRQILFERGSDFRNDIFDNFAAIQAVQAGSFNFHLVIGKTRVAEGFLLVDPELPAAPDGHRLPLSALAIQTCLSKNLGALKDWPKRLEVTYQSGYNMLHLTPIQELGKSRSAYCLRDQLRISPTFADQSDDREPNVTWTEVGALLQKMEKDWGILTITDLVFNHTANESPWVQQHPECAYNLVNSPHLRPAYLLDRIVWQLTLDIEAGKLADDGIADTLTEPWQMGAVHRYLWRQLAEFRLHEFYMAHVEDQVEALKTFLRKKLKSGSHPTDAEIHREVHLHLKPNKHYQRLKASVDLKDAAIMFYWNRADGPGRLEAACHEFRVRLEILNEHRYHEIQGHLGVAVNSVIANAQYRFLNPEGPCYGKPVSATLETPVMWTYFLHPSPSVDLDEAEKLMDSSRAAWIMAHNGWVMNDDPLRDFAGPDSNVYLRRELIPWGDSVKLHYGDSPESNPFLWNQMRQYTEITAQHFHGIRLDNCHSTPQHVAQYMMDHARAVRPDFYVIAELFTSSERTDNIFINKLGITALVREAMSAGDSHEEGRLVYRYGGIPVGSFCQQLCRPLLPSVANAVFYDVTHDNPSMVERRSRYDLLPSSALVLWADCANGSTRGFDEAVPHNVDVVTDERLYLCWGEGVTHKTGLIGARKALNALHLWLSREGFTEVFVDQVSTDVVTVTRHCPKDRRSAILVVHTAFGEPSEQSASTTRPLPIEGTVEEIMFEGTTPFVRSPATFVRDDRHVNGLSDFEVKFQEHIPVADSTIVSLSSSKTSLVFDNFPPGSAIAVLVKPHANAKEAIDKLDSINPETCKELRKMVLEMSNIDMNWLLFRCNPEERVHGPNCGVYNVPGYGDLNFAGLQGVMSLLAEIRPHNDLGHPLCDNLRNGDWFAGYVCSRLNKNPGTQALGSWLLENFALPLGKLPHYLKPCYFDKVITGVYNVTMDLLWTRLGVRKSSSLTKAFMFGSIQFYSVVQNCKMPPLSENLCFPAKEKTIDTKTAPFWDGGLVKEKGQAIQICPTLAAGFPHFAEGIWRNWGRDTFISLPGLLLEFCRWAEARECILGYAACLRHGLIPNLLGTAFSEERGVQPRYNARDAVWFWLAAIRTYAERAPNGVSILADPVRRFYPRCLEERVKSGKRSPPSSLTELLDGAVEMPLGDVIFEALFRHAQCDIDFVEWNAGPQLDEQMSQEGFNITAGIDWMTGFPYGGNGRNCGTWMDKMGSSDWANNRGVPATPRDGSAVELIGLCHYVLEFLKFVSEKGAYKHKGVNKKDGSFISWDGWLKLMHSNFEQRFWIPADCEDPALRLNRGIYRDSVGSSNKYTDNQFRPNFLVTMALAPSLFKPENAWRALQRVGGELLGPLGMRTLHPADLAYRGFYDNSDDSADFHVAHGFNYHQGPEWLWPVGFYLRAVLHFCRRQDAVESDAAVAHVQAVLARHEEVILSSHWRSLPELTNANGQPCAHSCNAQAWSVATLVEALNALLLHNSEMHSHRWSNRMDVMEWNP